MPAAKNIRKSENPNREGVGRAEVMALSQSLLWLF
jgi:hypothetical protein